MKRKIESIPGFNDIIEIIGRREVHFMRNKILIILYILAALPILYAYSHMTETRNWYLDAVNDTCGTEYGCEICHSDSQGGDSLTWDGLNFSDSGHDPRYFLLKSEY
jgi:hypothetical protein